LKRQRTNYQQKTHVLLSENLDFKFAHMFAGTVKIWYQY